MEESFDRSFVFLESLEEEVEAILKLLKLQKV